MPRQPEGKVVKRIKDYIVQHGGRPFKIQGGDESFQEVGIPDLLVSYRGRFFGLEVKLPGEIPSAVQRKVLNEIADAGGIAAVVTTVGQVATLLADVDREVDGGKTVRRPVDPYRFVGGHFKRKGHYY